ncbi:MAG TPA: hypothetical protein VMX17_06370 [Candidatus Glassbacteria bacterium]|nr:hypothetical protein [Candidatus Glassbacteria bacterium]
MNQEASFTFTTPLNVNIVNLKGEEHLFVEGDISTNDIDFVNDIMTENCQKSMQKQILERNMKLDLEHEAFKGDNDEEKEINKTKIPAGKIIDATVKDLGKGRFSTSVKCEINRFNPNYNTIKGNLVEKYLDAFSVAFLPTDISYEEKEGKSIRMLNDVILLNVAMTGNPCNTKAQMSEVFTKSMDALEEYKKRKALDPGVQSQLVVKNKSHSIEKSKDITKLHTKNSKMTEKTQEELEAENEESSENVEGKSLEMLKSISADLKSMKEKYDVVAKDNVSMKEAQAEMKSELSKITEALKQPVRKAMGNNINEVDKKAAEANLKSVDPLDLC